MKLLQTLKALVDLTFLSASFGTLAFLFYGGSDSLAPIFILALVHLIGYLCKGKAYRYAALLLAVPCLLFVQGVADAVMLLIALIYLTLALKQERYQYDSEDAIARFRWQAIALVSLAGVFSLFGAGAGIGTYTMPRIILYLVLSNLFLRFIRADAVTLASPIFVRAQMISVVAVLVAAVVVSSEALLSAVSNVVSYLYVTFIVPLFAGIAMVLVWGVVLLCRFIWFLIGGISVEEVTEVSMDYSVLTGTTEESTLNTIAFPSWMEWAATLVMAAVAIAVVWYVLRKMLAGAKQTDGDTVSITHQRVMAAEKEKQPVLFLTPRQKVRRYYASFMAHAKKHGIRVKATTDTATIEQRFGATAETAALTECYRHARYDETQPVSKEEARQAKHALRAIQDAGK